MTWTSNRTWVTGELVITAQMNEQVRDNLEALWVGTTAGDIDYFTSDVTKSRLAIGSARELLRMNQAETAPEWGDSGGGLGLIEEKILTSDTTTVTFAGIPQTYKNLRLYITARGTEAITSRGIYMRFNGRESAIYYGQNMYGIAATYAAAERLDQTSLLVGTIPCASATSDLASGHLIDILNYASATTYKDALTRAFSVYGETTADGRIWVLIGVYAVSEAITSLSLFSIAGNDFATNSIFTLYGQN